MCMCVCVCVRAPRALKFHFDGERSNLANTPSSRYPANARVLRLKKSFGIVTSGSRGERAAGTLAVFFIVNFVGDDVARILDWHLNETTCENGETFNC